MIKKLFGILLSLGVVAQTNVPTSSLNEITNTSTDTWIMVSDMNASPKSRKYDFDRIMRVLPTGILENPTNFFVANSNYLAAAVTSPMAASTKYIDATYGNDTTAQANNPAKPYKTLLSAFQSAADNDTFIIRSGRYEVSPPAASGSSFTGAAFGLTNKTGISIYGDPGTIITSATWGCPLVLQNTKKVTISGLTFHGPGVNGTNLGAAVLLNGTTEGLRFTYNTLSNWFDQGISTLFDNRDAKDCEINFNRFVSGGTSKIPSLQPYDGAAISVTGTGLQIVGNTITDWARGIELESVSYNKYCTNVIVANNILRGIWDYGIMIIPYANSAERFRNIIVQGNSLTGRSANLVTGIAFHGGIDCTIQNNDVTDFQSGVGMIGVWSTVRGGIISGNNITTLNGSGDSVYALSAYYGVENMLIQNNQINAINANSGVYANGKDILITGNRIEGPAWGVQLVNGTNSVVSDNWVSDWYRHIEVGGQYNVISGNHIFPAGGTPLVDNGLSTIKFYAFTSLSPLDLTASYSLSGLWDFNAGLYSRAYSVFYNGIGLTGSLTGSDGVEINLVPTNSLGTAWKIKALAGTDAGAGYLTFKNSDSGANMMMFDPSYVLRVLFPGVIQTAHGMGGTNLLGRTDFSDAVTFASPINEVALPNSLTNEYHFYGPVYFHSTNTPGFAEVQFTNSPMYHLTTSWSPSGATNYVVDVTKPSLFFNMTTNLNLVHATNGTANFSPGTNAGTHIFVVNSSGTNFPINFNSSWKRYGSATASSVVLTNGDHCVISVEFSGPTTSQTNVHAALAYKNY